MKKILLAILAIVYLGVSSGIAMNIHYCMGKISSVDVYHKAHDKCDNCGMKSSNCGCCKDEVKIFKLKDTHKLIYNDIKIFASVAIIENHKNIFDSVLPSAEIISSYNNHSPPASQGISLYILNNVFRI
ncbi:MAG: hypothetical protein M3004_05675 [Bacteroidota bacterium]|nr:hypothetical protein [Bacteroidota bacterium]